LIRHALLSSLPHLLLDAWPGPLCAVLQICNTASVGSAYQLPRWWAEERERGSTRHPGPVRTRCLSRDSSHGLRASRSSSTVLDSDAAWDTQHRIAGLECERLSRPWAVSGIDRERGCAPRKGVTPRSSASASVTIRRRLARRSRSCRTIFCARRTSSQPLQADT